MRVGVLALLAGSYGEHAGGVEPRGQRGRLTRLRYEQNLVVSALLAHLFQSVGDVLGHDLGLILKLHELVAAVAGDVQEHVAPRVGEEPLGPRGARRVPVGEDAQEVLGRDLVPAVVDLDVIAVEVGAVVRVAEHRRRERVPRGARDVVGEHEDDVTVGDAEALDGAVERQGVGYVPVVEPVPARVDQHRPVAGVIRSARWRRRRRLEERLGAARGGVRRGISRRVRDEREDERECTPGSHGVRPTPRQCAFVVEFRRASRRKYWSKIYILSNHK